MPQAEKTNRERFIDPKLLQRLGNMQVRARTVVNGAIAGLHRSDLKGASVEFAEYKEYSPGDEIRHIDWRTFARTDRYYVKQFEDETNLRAYLVLDTSGSMDYGFEDVLSKYEYATYLAAALAFLLVRQGDAVGLLTFAEQPGVFIPANSRQSHLDDLFKVLEKHPRRHKTDLSAALAQLAKRAKRQSLAFIFTDMLDTAPEALNMAKVLRQRRFDVALFHLVDPSELTFPFEGLTLFEGLENDGVLLVDPDDIRTHYQEELTSYFEKLERELIENDIDYYRIETDRPLETVLLEFLNRRRQRRRERRREPR